MTVVDDGSYHTVSVLQGYHSGVGVAGFLDGGVEVLAYGVNLGDVVQEETSHVEVVDGHVAEDTAGDLYVLGRRGGGVAGDDQQGLQVTDLAVGNSLVQGGEGGVEAAVEAEHNRNLYGVQLSLGSLNVLHVQSNGLLAQHCLASLGGSQQVRNV